MTPVSQWKVRKYSGNDHALGLNEFLSHIEQLALSEHATELDLFDSAVHLFEGAALSWYTSCRNQRLLHNWPQLVQELQNEFRHPDLDSVLRTKIYQTRQQKGESFQQYYLQVNKLFQAMSHPLADSEKLEVLKTNLRYDCRKALVGKNVTTLRELLTIGKDLDATDFSAFTKVFGPPKRETCAIDYNSRNATGSKTFVNQNRQRGSPAIPKNSKPESNNSKPDSKPVPTSKRNPFEKAGKSEGSPPDPKPGPSKPSALLKLISNYSPPEEGQCFNCREYHNLSECPIPRRVFCNRCALIGFTTNNCPYCLKKRAGEALKSQGPHAARSGEAPEMWLPDLYQLYDQRSEEEDEEDRSLSQIHKITLNSITDDRPHAQLKIFDITVNALLDCGSNLTFINAAVFQKLKNVQLREPAQEVELRTADGSSLEILGEVHLPFSFNGKTRVLPTLVAPRLTKDCICGMDFWRLFRIYPAISTITRKGTADEPISATPPQSLSEAQQQRLEKLKLQFKTPALNTLDTTPICEHEIVLKEESKLCKPIRLYPYPIAPKIQTGLFEEIDRLLEIGIIEESNSDWSLNIVPIRKASGAIRLCLDARKLNERTVRDAYPLPHPGRILGRLPRANYLSTIDLTEAFLQIPLARKSRKYCAFSVQGKGMFQFTRLPFGLINSPATLARLMNRVLGHGVLEPNVFVYLDDIVIVTETFEEHVRLLEEVARRLREANLSIKLEKSHFCLSEIPFLGYILSSQGLRINPEKIRPIVEFERPTTITKLRRFLGMSNYYRRFIPEYSKTTAALSELLKSASKSVRWTPEAEEAFQAIKEKLITSPVLSSPDFDQNFIIHTDASDLAVAGVLTQRINDQERVIEYFSKKLTTQERAYHATEKEGLATLLSIEHFRGYIEGSPFVLVTDSSALTFIMRTKWKTSSRLSRWSLSLQMYDMTIVHRRGKDNVVPDALSRSVMSISATSPSSWYTDLKLSVLNRPDDYPDFRVDGDQLKKANARLLPSFASLWKCLRESIPGYYAPSSVTSEFSIGIKSAVTAESRPRVAEPDIESPSEPFRTLFLRSALCQLRQLPDSSSQVKPAAPIDHRPRGPRPDTEGQPGYLSPAYTIPVPPTNAKAVGTAGHKTPVSAQLPRAAGGVHSPVDPRPPSIDPLSTFIRRTDGRRTTVHHSFGTKRIHCHR
ncbi:uncharacterized protein LOC134286499 [Aedes albopictus]|uniref:Reverse transcriptase domain-containing protein n=1 Tax=Aedes albopictus TaxID=7160 RepID=A0ABM1XTM0_AEDAL